MENKIDVKARSRVIVFLIILVLLFASLFVTTSVYIIRYKKNSYKDNNKTNASSQTFSTLCDKYVGNKAESGISGETKVSLYLYEDGSFCYNNEPGLASGLIGYFTFNDNEIVLHGIVQRANDPGRTIISENVTLKINSDGSFTDNKLNVTLQKSTEEFRNETDIISTELRSALDNHFLD